MCKYQEKKPDLEEDLRDKISKADETADSMEDFYQKVMESIADKEEKEEKSKNSEKEWFEED